MTREEATAMLMAELEKGWRSGEEEGWISLDEVEALLGIKEFSSETEAAMLEAQCIASDDGVKGYTDIDELFSALKD